MLEQIFNVLDYDALPDGLTNNIVDIICNSVYVYIFSYI